jgi:hypothetical protein
MTKLQEMQSYCWYRRWNVTSYSEEWTFLLPRNRWQTREDLRHTLTPPYADFAPICSTLDWWNIQKLLTNCHEFKSLTSPEGVLNLQPCLIFLTSMTKTTYPIPTLSHVHTLHAQHSKRNSNIQRYESHVHMYCIHPPLGKLHTHTDIMQCKYQ